MIDPVDLTARLVRCPSITPNEAGALVILQDILTQAGFLCTRVDRGDVSNLFARFGPKGAAKTFGFNGHIDVVPIGNRQDWSVDPFGADIIDGWLYGRGATDMKSGVAAFVAAATQFVGDLSSDDALILTITGDEEGPAKDGTSAILNWMASAGEKMDVCLVGEPTCPNYLGEMIKIGRRGSMTAFFTVTGVQGHAAYPAKACNPLPPLVDLMNRFSSHKLDDGSDHFDPSNLAVVTIDTGNTATNVIPGTARATVNIRYNDCHTSETLTHWMRTLAADVAGQYGVDIDLDVKSSGDSFVTPPGALADLVVGAVQAQTNHTPVFSTTGGTSDARFIKDHCPVIEFGLTGHRMHGIDERVEVAQIQRLQSIYEHILRSYFS